MLLAAVVSLVLAGAAGLLPEPELAGTRVPAAEVSTAPAPQGTKSSAEVTELPPGLLNARFDAIVRRWTAEAARRSKNVANAENVTVAVLARDLERGVDLVSRNADRSLRPASNMKLVTTAAALVLLGSSMEFVTPFEAAGPVVDGVLRGDLVVRASGDPLCEEDGNPRVEPRLAAVARTIRDRGIRSVHGDLVLDEGTFPQPGPGPGWPDASQHWAEYCARAGGFTVNGGVLCAEVRPGPVGQSARVEVHPSPHGLASRYGVRTTGGPKLDVRVGATVSAVTVRGELPHTRRDYRAEFSHPRPVELFAAVLREELREAGVVVRGTTRRERAAKGGPRIAELRSPVDAILGPINADSRNGVADQLFLALGHTIASEGTRAGGLAATLLAFERLGVPTAGFHQVDGSGLSRDDRATARQIAALLEAVLGGEEASAARFRDSLALAGRRGTLESRLRETPSEGRVAGKTGWIAGVSALSGVAESLDGRSIVFSILVEYPARAGGLNTHCFKPMQDEMVRVLVEELP